MARLSTGDAAWRRTRLRHLTNFGYLHGDSEALEVELQQWSYVLPAFIGRMQLRYPLPLWLTSGSAQALTAAVATTRAALQGFARLHRCMFGYKATPSDIQGWSASLPVGEGGHDPDIAESVVRHGLAGQITTGLILDFEMLVTCRSALTHDLGDYWLPLRVHMSPNYYVSPAAAGTVDGAGDASIPRSVPWTAKCDAPCASLFLRDNALMLAKARAYWRACQQVDPEIEVAPGDQEDYQMLVTEAQPTAPGATNEELWSINYPRLVSAIAQWERALASTFEWVLEE